MYNRFNNKRFNSSRQGGNRGGIRRIKTFDPTNHINAPVREFAPQEEYITVNSFDTFKISDVLKRNIIEHGYKTPTPIQDQAIPAILSGRDIIGIASTGTGKTAAFLIPLIDMIIRDRNHKVLVITPTRELASQIKDELVKFSRGLQIYSTLCIGGTNIHRQRNELSRHPNFVIGTPGRLKDLIKTGNLNMSVFGSIVLDEADRMVDMGFIGEIKYFISLLPTHRLSLFFSATIDENVRGILKSFVKDPVTVSIKKNESAYNIDQKVLRVSDPGKKIDMLHDLLKKEEFSKVLIFGRTKHGVQKLSDLLSKNGFRSGAIHGNKNQSQRTRILDNFKRNNLDILVATDVAARGLDIPNVSHVINFDMPESLEAYTHRIGRTGRAGNRGFAVTFVN